MAFFLFECDPSIPMDTIRECREQLKRIIIPPNGFFIYSGTDGNYRIKVSVILNDNESLASLYDNVKEITSNTHIDIKPHKRSLFKRIRRIK